MYVAGSCGEDSCDHGECITTGGHHGASKHWCLWVDSLHLGDGGHVDLYWVLSPSKSCHIRGLSCHLRDPRLFAPLVRTWVVRLIRLSFFEERVGTCLSILGPGGIFSAMGKGWIRRERHAPPDRPPFLNRARSPFNVPRDIFWAKLTTRKGKIEQTRNRR